MYQNTRWSPARAAIATDVSIVITVNPTSASINTLRLPSIIHEDPSPTSIIAALSDPPAPLQSRNRLGEMPGVPSWLD